MSDDKNKSRLSLRLKREWLVEASTENLVRLALFLGCPTWNDFPEGQKRHNIINAIQRVEKSFELNRKHPYKKEDDDGKS